jgi:hypothetical protein
MQNLLELSDLLAETSMRVGNEKFNAPDGVLGENGFALSSAEGFNEEKL